MKMKNENDRGRENRLGMEEVSSHDVDGVHLPQPPRDRSPCHPACGGSQSSTVWMRLG